MTDENMLARGVLQDVDHPELGHVNLPHTPLNIKGVPRLPIQPSLPLGAGNAEIYGQWLGLSEDDLERLKKDGVI